MSYVLTIAPANGTDAPQVEETAESMDELVPEVWARWSQLPVGTTMTVEEPNARWTITHLDGSQDTLTIGEAPHPAAEAFDLIRAALPDAVSFNVVSSDQGSYGYLLGSIRTATGTVAGVVAGNDLMDAVDDVLRDLDWGVFGDTNKDSVFLVSMETQQIIRATR